MEESVDEEVVNLRHSSSPFNSKVVDDRPVVPGREVEVDDVCSVALGLSPGADLPNLKGNRVPSARWAISASAERGKLLEILAAITVGLDEH